MPRYRSNWRELWEREAFIMTASHDGEIYKDRAVKLESVTAYEAHKS